MSKLNYDDLAERAIAGGFTVNLAGKSPSKGYAVSIRPDAERRLTALRGSWDVADAIYAYVVHHGHDLQSGYYLGAWRDENEIVLDLVTVVDDRAWAARLARQNKQQAFFDLEHGSEIFLAPTWDRERALDEDDSDRVMREHE